MRLCLTVLLAVWLGGCASAVSSGYGQGGLDASGRSYADARADNRITSAVTSALVRDREVPAMDIDVRTHHGVVTLSGSVPSTEVARRAARIAAGLPEVERVENRLRIAR
jgi:osmotically-inducible protein OsmY